MKKSLIAILTVVMYLNMITTASAQYVVSSPTPSSNIAINKLVQNPQNNQFVKDLCSSNINFLPNQTVTFEIDVTNTGQTQLTNTQIKDILPSFLNFVSGPGSFDNNSNTETWTIPSLNVGEKQSFQIKAQVKDAKSLPAGVTTCLTNTTQVSVNQLFAQSTAMLGVQTQILAPVQQLPVTGPRETTEILIGSVVLLLTSVFLFVKSSKIEGR